MTRTDSELSYLRTMIEGLSNLLNIAVKNRDWDLVEMLAREIEHLPKDAAEKAAKNFPRAA